MSQRFVLGRENVLCVAEVVNRSLKADCTDFTDICTDVSIHPLHGTLGFIKSYRSVNVKFIEHPQCFTFFFGL